MLNLLVGCMGFNWLLLMRPLISSTFMVHLTIFKHCYKHTSMALVRFICYMCIRTLASPLKYGFSSVELCIYVCS